MTNHHYVSGNKKECHTAKIFLIQKHEIGLLKMSLSHYVKIQVLKNKLKKNVCEN
ncbi:hypothetical protein SMWW4_v1c18430 [Serratia marcescens WW4]|nr:hypothetical protein SMWW4_v1c18430 [Serratia marcescens WW4]